MNPRINYNSIIILQYLTRWNSGKFAETRKGIARKLVQLNPEFSNTRIYRITIDS